MGPAEQADLFDDLKAKGKEDTASARGSQPPPPPVPPAGGGNGNGDNDSAPLAQYAEVAYLQYAISVVKGRALPDVADGQKPVQRRILYAMSEMGLAPNAKPVKSARVVGDVLGRFHPHGDASTYEALVRVAQDFSLRYPLIDGHGNFGSPDGDPAAAYRYTECRLTPIASLLLDELGQGTVDFVPNYDGSAKEPALLPARLPFVLLNGASGIAVGMATEMPSHNLKEVADACVRLVEQPKTTLPEILKVLPGPDFPGGGQLISSPAEIAQVYETGRGPLKLRARWRIEEMARGQWQLVVTELPPLTNARKVLEEIEELTNPKVKLGKKSLTQDQLQLKQLLLASLDGVRDESGKDARVRLVFEPKSRNQDQQAFAQLLLAHTSLEGNFPANLVAIGRDGRPRQKALLEILNEWIEFRIETLRRRSAHRLERVRDRLHVLEGRQLVLLNIDKVIRIIRQADDPKADLIKAFKLSERQADDILEIRLRQLAKLEAIKIEQEMKELQAEQNKLQKLLDKPAALRGLLVTELREDAKKFGDARRTLIERAEVAEVEVPVIDEPLTVILSQKGWIRARQGHGIEAASITFKEGDGLLALQECRSVDAVTFIASHGRVYTVAASALPGGRGDGQPITSLIELGLGARVVGMVCGQPAQKLLLATTDGYGLICAPANLNARNKAGKQFVNLNEGAQLLKPHAFDPQRAKAVAAVSQQGRLLIFLLEEMKELPSGGRGVILMGLDQDETLTGAVALGGEVLVVSGTGRGGKAAEQRLSAKELNEYAGKRARKGKQIARNFSPLAVGTAQP